MSRIANRISAQELKSLPRGDFVYRDVSARVLEGLGLRVTRNKRGHWRMWDCDHRWIAMPDVAANFDDARRIAAQLFGEISWHVSAGRLNPEEPWYGAQMVTPDGTEVLAEAECNATPAACLCLCMLAWAERRQA